VVDEPYGELSDSELLTKMRGYTVGDMRSAEMGAELDRRQTIAQMKASSAQVRSAWFQLAAVIAITTAISACVQWWIAAHLH
jgi:hypothetical protein